MRLELRKPYFVILGNWNPAIFQPGWIAEHVFQIPNGQEFEFILSQQIRQETFGIEVVESQSPAVLYHSQVGINCLPNRLEFFVNDLATETLRLAEQAAIRVLDTLSHTPLGPFGVNFEFRDDDPDEEITDIIETRENLAHIKPVSARDFRTRLNFNGDCDLNFKRCLNDAGLELNFNFHHQIQTIDQIKAAIPGIFERYYELLIESFREKYELQPMANLAIAAHNFEQPRAEQEE